MWVLALLAFVVTVLLVLWRPGGLHEAVPALIGAFIMFCVGLVAREDVSLVARVVLNSAITIISTFVMASVLDGAGFFSWAGDRLMERANGSGRRLFHLVLAFSTFLTLFLNNDGSILLGTPVVLRLVRRLKLPPRAAFAYLIGACLIASASSPPIGVSNMANLEGMTLVGISLTEHFRTIAFAAIVGLAACWTLLYAILQPALPTSLEPVPVPNVAPDPPVGHPHAARHHRPPVPPHHRIRSGTHGLHPTAPMRKSGWEKPTPDLPFMWFAVAVVVLVRVGFFVASLVHVPPYLVAATGASVLLLANAVRKVMDTPSAVRRAPWPVLGFAFGMDLVVMGLRNAGLIDLLANLLAPVVQTILGASVVPGVVVTAVSSLLNNHPGLIIGSLTLLEYDGISRHLFATVYAGVVLGSDIGALLTPIGTLASLIWFHLLQQDGRRVTWGEYLRITAIVIPASFGLALLGLYTTALLARP